MNFLWTACFGKTITSTSSLLHGKKRVFFALRKVPINFLCSLSCRYVVYALHWWTSLNKRVGEIIHLRSHARLSVLCVLTIYCLLEGLRLVEHHHRHVLALGVVSGKSAFYTRIVYERACHPRRTAGARFSCRSFTQAKHCPCRFLMYNSLQQASRFKKFGIDVCKRISFSQIFSFHTFKNRYRCHSQTIVFPLEPIYTTC